MDGTALKGVLSNAENGILFEYRVFRTEFSPTPNNKEIKLANVWNLCRDTTEWLH